MQPTELGPYRIGPPLGKGGMGSVYRATHQESGDRVAVKVLNPQLAVSEGFRERFDAEIQSLQTLRHASIVRLYGYGEQQGNLFYAMELVEGSSLEEELRNGRRFSWREAVEIAIQLSRALKHAHDHGVVHRDIKPANILLGQKGRVKLADFGIARLFGASGVTIAGGVLGTADYMSPEQAAGKPVSPRSDQYSVGCVLYALLAGRPPFRASDLTEMLQLQRFAVAEPVSKFAPHVPVELEKIVSQLLEKEPSKRFPNTLVLARCLEAMVHAMSKPAADDFELIEESPVRSDPKTHDAHLAVTEASIDIEIVPSSAEEPHHQAGTTPSASQAAGVAEAEEPYSFAPPSRYTEVPQTEASAPGEWRSLLSVALVLGLACTAVLGTLWWWTQPLNADALYQRIAESHERLDTSRATFASVAEFARRFPDDPRTYEVAAWGRALEVDRLRKLVAHGRLDSNALGDDLTAIEVLLQRAVHTGERDPAAGAEMFDHLANLLSTPRTDQKDGGEIEALRELSRKESERLRSVATEQEQRVVEFAAERLDAAKALLPSDPTRAAKIAESVLALVRPGAQNAALRNQAQHLINQARVLQR